ncbi:replication fork protection component Swi3-domain-containing protein [Rhodocollybia butyracea]|uniref:Chromosome segregation in meiosis protein n=1 Tax=Rhodocollybia butyracea TaxID=206335 RepID=A0A9P5UDK2_9AGAR|nr:replication fork protection component Swi3-domain-containing protein [Rhodocollybia butyracea]
MCTSDKRWSRVHMDIFDDDNEVEFVSRPSTSASTASSSSGNPLFLPDDDEDNFGDHNQDNHPSEHQDNVDEIFDNALGDDLNFDYVPLARNSEIDYDELEREAQRKAKIKVPRHAILSSSPPPDLGNDASKGRKGKGKDDGEKLIEDTKHFRIKGKGHEETDLKRLLQIYQYWTHRMYPKSQFKDTVARVEKLCHSKLMHNKLSMWRDEAHGKTHPDTDEEVVENGDEVVANPGQEISATKRASSSAPVSDAAAYASSSASPPARPPSSAPSNTGDEFDDQDMEAIFKEMEMEQANEAHRAATATNSKVKVTSDEDFMDVDDDIEAWLALDEGLNNQSTTTLTTASMGLSPAAASTSTDKGADLAEVEDEGMWELSREMETEASKQVAPHSIDGSATSKEASARRVSTAEEGFDEMYC